MNIKYINIPSSLLFDQNISSFAKLLYGELCVLSYKNGICKVSNGFLADANHCSTRKIIRALNSLKEPPALVITDSQAFKKVSEIVPENIPLTSFSILFARLKGDLEAFISGASAIDDLKDGDKVLILESCTHHAIEDDIGKVKIPNLLKKKTGKNLITFKLFDNEQKFNIADFKNRVETLLDLQDTLLVILNTPAHNPTGFALSEEDWDKAISEGNAISGYSLVSDVTKLYGVDTYDNTEMIFALPNSTQDKPNTQMSAAEYFSEDATVAWIDTESGIMSQSGYFQAADQRVSKLVSGEDGNCVSATFSLDLSCHSPSTSSAEISL